MSSRREAAFAETGCSPWIALVLKNVRRRREHVGAESGVLATFQQGRTPVADHLDHRSDPTKNVIICRTMPPSRLGCGRSFGSWSW